MRDSRHIASALKKLSWPKAESGICRLHRSSFKDAKLWTDIQDFLKSERLKGTEELEDSLFLDDFRYWFDAEGNIYRQQIIEEPVTDSILTSWLRKMMKFFDSLPDNSEICSSDLFEKVCHVQRFFNHSQHWWQMAIDGKFYGEYIRKDGCETDIDWALFDRFSKAVERRKNTIIEDCSRVAFLALGLPFNVPDIYRKKAPLLEEAHTLSEKNAVCDEAGNLLFYHKFLHPSDGNILEIIKLMPCVPAIKRENDDRTKMLAVLDGKVRLEAFHQRLVSDSVEGDGEVYWQDNDSVQVFNGHGSIYCRHDRSYEDPPIPAFYQITNTGNTEALILISCPPKFHPSVDTDE